jgi:hypothetical protein
MEVRYHEIRRVRRGHFVQPTMHLLMTCTDPSFSLYLDVSLSFKATTSRDVHQYLPNNGLCPKLKPKRDIKLHHKED